MKYISLCSGIEAATVAWDLLGWKPLFFSEIEKFPTAVLQHHFPHVENKGDITKYEQWEQCPVDLVVGGTPCQSFSIAGERKGTEDSRGHLIYSYLGIVGKYKPTWVLWENVPGVLSSNKGLDFASFLSGLEECGYGWCYRMLDAQYFGVPQRRSRVFVVGHIGGRTDLAAKVLFESEGVCRDFTTGGGKEQTDTRGIKNGTTETSTYNLFERKGKIAETNGISQTIKAVNRDTVLVYDSGGFANIKECADVSPTVLSVFEKQGRNNIFVLEKNFYNAHGQDGRIEDANGVCQTVTAHFAKGAGSIPVVCENNSSDAILKELGDKGSTVISRWGTGVNNVPLVNKLVRRITPLETERLQGLPDNWTKIPWNGKEAEYCPDGLRYKAVGNSMAVDVMRWIGKRIEAVDKGQRYG